MRRKSRAGQFVPNTGMARKVALDIVRGLQYLHSRSPKVVHFDVKVPIPIPAQLWTRGTCSSAALCSAASQETGPVVL